MRRTLFVGINVALAAVSSLQAPPSSLPAASQVQEDFARPTGEIHDAAAMAAVLQQLPYLQEVRAMMLAAGLSPWGSRMTREARRGLLQTLAQRLEVSPEAMSHIASGQCIRPAARSAWVRLTHALGSPHDVSGALGPECCVHARCITGTFSQHATAGGDAALVSAWELRAPDTVTMLRGSAQERDIRDIQELAQLNVYVDSAQGGPVSYAVEIERGTFVVRGVDGLYRGRLPPRPTAGRTLPAHTPKIGMVGR